MKPLEILMVDNGSTDGSCEFVRQTYPEVRIISLPKNTGFAYAVNRGIENSAGGIIALLNNDIELDEHWLEYLVAGLESDRSVGSVACKMLNFYDRSMIDAAGDALTRVGSPYTRGYAEKDHGQFDKREYTVGACAGAALFKREVFERVGMFDEDFISYYEDIDLTVRAQLAGFKCLYIPEAICYHKRGATANLISDYPIRMGERNLTMFLFKDFPAPILLLKFPFILASRARRVYRAMRAGLARATWVGLLEGILLVPSALKKRRNIQRTRTVSLSYVNSLMRRRP
ncbi:MAG: glycosyl transferase, family 2 [Bacteroidetes bacterium]|nr:glycosyl transferase, family 2 [Bacteroidota bacterium]